MACFRCGAIMEYATSSFEKLREKMARQSGFQIQMCGSKSEDCANDASGWAPNLTARGAGPSGIRPTRFATSALPENICLWAA